MKLQAGQEFLVSYFRGQTKHHILAKSFLSSQNVKHYIDFYKLSTIPKFKKCLEHVGDGGGNDGGAIMKARVGPIEAAAVAVQKATCGRR